MNTFKETLDNMRHNAKDWRIQDIKTVAKHFDINFQQPGTSHVTFRFKNGKKITIPAHKPLKPIYVKQFLALLDEVKPCD